MRIFAPKKDKVMANKKKLTDIEFIELIINKELEIADAPIRFKDIVEDHKKPDGERKLDDWFSDYSFKTPEEYYQWKEFFLEHFYDWKPLRYLKKYVEEQFSWISLQYGLKFDFEYEELDEYLKQQNNNKKGKE